MCLECGVESFVFSVIIESLWPICCEWSTGVLRLVLLEDAPIASYPILAGLGIDDVNTGLIRKLTITFSLLSCHFQVCLKLGLLQKKHVLGCHINGDQPTWPNSFRFHGAFGPQCCSESTLLKL